MKYYEYRRLTFYALVDEFNFEDQHKNFDIIHSPDTVVQDAIEYLRTGTSYLRFPGAARAVAISTAAIVSSKFNEDFFEVLNNTNLMNNNDPYFQTYTQSREEYDQILSVVPLGSINWNSERMQITKRLILEEYMLDEIGLKRLPFNAQ